MRTVILAGSPCSGKTTLAASLAGPGDVVLDFDVIAQELGSPTQWNHAPEYRWAAEQEMQARIAAVKDSDVGGTSWVIRAAPRASTRAALARDLGAEVYVVNPGVDECLRRALEDGRPAGTDRSIRKWFRRYRPWSGDQDPSTLTDRPDKRVARTGRGARRSEEEGLSMDVITKAIAEVQPGDDEEESPTGSFHVILSAETKDRDGENLYRDEWDTLPDWLHFDADHTMDVAGTIGSGIPTIEDDGCLHVRGAYTSLEQGQKVRTLVNEGHIRHTSVTFMTSKEKKDGKNSVRRELLNGAFVAIPSNREAVVLSSKEFGMATVKVGARNNSSDRAAIQAIHDTAAELGATCSTGDAERADTGEQDGANKGFDLDVDEFAEKVAAAITKATTDAGGDEPVPPVTKDAVEAAGDVETKAMTDGVARVAELAKATDAAIDEARDVLAGVDVESLPPEVKQAIDLVSAAGESVDELLDVLGVDDPDDEDDAAEGDMAIGGDVEKSVDQAETKGVSTAPWDGSASRFSMEQYRASCLIGPDEPSDSKNDYKLPVKEPNGDVNKNAVHTAAAALAGGRGGVDAPADEKVQAAKKLVGLYRNQLKEDPPESLLTLAGESPKDDAKSADPASADVKSADAGSADEDVNNRARALLIATQAQAL